MKDAVHVDGAPLPKFALGSEVVQWWIQVCRPTRLSWHSTGTYFLEDRGVDHWSGGIGESFRC